MKLTKRLKEVLQFMNSGWKLKHSHDGSWWMQNKKLETLWIHGGSETDMHKLICLKLIKKDCYNFPTEKYHLTEKGKDFECVLNG